ncbi:MAG TPA: GDSL-type esterase/lipase family protein [Candidatus Hydrogenedentes bacterium]|nr:GDSL-type esterase/lipase family protein [Candidatus Hydrogenedentota bacterium]
MKKWAGRTVFFLLTLLLWMICFCVVLEGWTRWRWKQIEATNPFLLSLVAGELWPIIRDKSDDFSDGLYDEVLRANYRGPGKSMERLPEPTAEEEMRRRILYFMRMPQEDRQMFANVFEFHIHAIRKDGIIAATFSEPQVKKQQPLNTFLGEAAVRPLLDAFDEVRTGGEIRFFPKTEGETAGPFGYCLFSENTFEEETGEPLVWVIYPKTEIWRAVPENSLWEMPFFIYKKHVEQQDIISVLAITEHFYMNNYGFRDADIYVPGPEDSYRILCLGASTTEEGPVNELTYPAILEMRLNQHFGGKKIDVINCGLSGMNSSKHKMRMADYLALEPDMILIYNAVNDICHELIPGWVNRATRFQQYLRKSQFVIRYLGKWIMPPEQEMAADIDCFKIENLRQMEAYTREKGVALALCSFAAPNRERLNALELDYYEYTTRMKWGGRYISFDMYLHILKLYNEAIKKLCAERGLLYIPLAEKLDGTANLFGDICHQRNPGIEKKADIVCEALIPVLEKELHRTAITDRTEAAAEEESNPQPE